MKKNGYTIVELLVVFALFGIFFFISANKVSYAFDYDYETELYNQTITSIEKCASIYGQVHKDLFEEEKDIYITIDELAKEGYVISTGEDKVKDPRDPSKDLNDLKVKMTLEDDTVTAKVLV